MQLFETQLDSSLLAQLAAEAIGLLCARDFDTLTQRFPYALAHGRNPAAAVAEDLAQCFLEAPGVEQMFIPGQGDYTVCFFEPNDITLRALIECRFVSAAGDTLLVELVVIGRNRMVFALEGISVFRAETEIT